MNHIDEERLALFAGGDLGFFSRFVTARHVAGCEECRCRVGGYAALRQEICSADAVSENLNWKQLEAEMRANIRLGLEAGACVAPARVHHHVNPRFAIAFASLCILAASGIALKVHPVAKSADPASELQATRSGLEFRRGENSLTLLNHHGTVSEVSVGAQGEIRGRFVDGDTGSVTINNVYLEN